MNIIEIGKRIEEIQKSVDVDQITLAKLMGVSTTTASNWTTGKKRPGTEKLVLLAELGEVSLDWLILGKGTGLQKSGEIVSTISPGNNKATRNIKEQATRPTAKLPHLKWIVEWMDLYFADNEEQALLFYEQLKDIKPSFVDFIESEKKPTNKDHQDGLLGSIQNGDY